MDLDWFDQCWFALQVRPRYEFMAATILHNKGFEEFLPTYKSERKWSDRKKEIELPLFPGYIFCRFNKEIQVPILTTPGVIRVVGGNNSAIPSNEIAAIQAVVAGRIPASPCAYIEIGTRVRVITGSLAGVEGILISYRNQYRLILSVTLVQNSISIEVEHTDVTPVQEGEYPFTEVEHRPLQTLAKAATVAAV